MQKIIQFIREAKEELRKVTWPDREEVTSFTMVVVAALLFISIYLWIIDSALVALFQYLTK